MAFALFRAPNIWRKASFILVPWVVFPLYSPLESLALFCYLCGLPVLAPSSLFLMLLVGRRMIHDEWERMELYDLSCHVLPAEEPSGLACLHWLSWFETLKQEQW